MGGEKEVYQTCRPTVEAAERILGVKYPCLDKGYVELVDYMGGDDAIVQAARVTPGMAGLKGKEKDRKLIRYLMRHRHTSPFEMVELKFHAEMPIFVARQWVRHRTANINERSMRYKKAKDRFYIPAEDDVQFQSKDNMQGRSDEEVSGEVVGSVVGSFESAADEGMARYLELVDKGISRELARGVLPITTYTEWFWKIDLHNLMHFLQLRMDPHAQKEIRAYATQMARITQQVAPLAFEAFMDYRVNGLSLSAQDIHTLRESKDWGEGLEKLAERNFNDNLEREEFLEKARRLVGE